MKWLARVGIAVALLAESVAIVVWAQTARIEHRLPGAEREGDNYRWYCTVTPDGFGLCSFSALDNLLPENAHAVVQRPRAAACFVHHRISTDETRAVCAYTPDGCQMVRTAFAESPDSNEISECAGVDLVELDMRRYTAQIVIAVAAIWIVCFGLLWLVIRQTDRLGDAS